MQENICIRNDETFMELAMSRLLAFDGVRKNSCGLWGRACSAALYTTPNIIT
jgi:hypothetical protein